MAGICCINSGTVLGGRSNIEQVLICLKKIAQECESKGRLNREHVQQAIEFFRKFADQRHHGKEEDRLFPLAQERGIPRERGSIGQMLSEHTIGREAIRKMDESVPAASEGEEPALTSYLEGTWDYIDLLRTHFQKEDRVLFPMVDRVLSSQDQENLMVAFKEAEKDLHDADTHERCLEIANRLAEHFGVRKTTESQIGLSF